MKDLFRGKLVRLTMEEPEVIAKSQAQWRRDTEFHRLLDGKPAALTSEKKIKEWLEQHLLDGEPRHYSFSVRTLDGDRHIGSFSLWVDVIHSEAWIGIGIGDRESWGKGYGTDMLKLCLQYTFTELCLERVTLGLHDYNPRALRSYEKCGFRLEGRTRQDEMREGRRNDSLWMGILREEWLQMQPGDQT